MKPCSRETEHRAVFEVPVRLDEEEAFERAGVEEEGSSEVAATKLDQCAYTSAPSAYCAMWR